MPADAVTWKGAARMKKDKEPFFTMEDKIVIVAIFLSSFTVSFVVSSLVVLLVAKAG